MNRAQRRAQVYNQRPRREPVGGYQFADVVKSRGTSGRNNRAVVPHRDAVKLREFEKGGEDA